MARQSLRGLPLTTPHHRPPPTPTSNCPSVATTPVSAYGRQRGMSGLSPGGPQGGRGTPPLPGLVVSRGDDDPRPEGERTPCRRGLWAKEGLGVRGSGNRRNRSHHLPPVLLSGRRARSRWWAGIPARRARAMSLCLPNLTPAWAATVHMGRRCDGKSAKYLASR